MHGDYLDGLIWAKKKKVSERQTKPDEIFFEENMKRKLMKI
jgi:hypothetical protein